MADISNKALSLLLLVAIVVSVSGTMLTFSKLSETGITGRATDDTTGITNFSINSTLSIRFNNNLIPFGQGYVNDSIGSCVMGTNNSNPSAANGCVGFNTTVADANLTIENDGNIPANVSINFTGDASSFIGGTSPSFMYMVRNAEASSCTTANATSMREVAGTDTNTTMTRVCTNFDADDGSDLFDIAIWLRVPEDASTGAHSVTITALACDDTSC